MASQENTYSLYSREIDLGDISREELERIARGESVKPRRAPRKTRQRAPTKRTRRRTQATMKKAAREVTARRVNVIAGLVVTGLGLGGLWAMPKHSVQSAPENAAPMTTVTFAIPQASAPAPHAYVSNPPKAREAAPAVKAAPVAATPAVTKEAAPAVHDRVLDAQRIVNAPLTDAELRAKPFFDRMIGNRELMRLFHSVSATTGTPIPTLMEVNAAETGGRPGNALQVTALEFPQLVGAYGSAYAAQMETYAATLSGEKQARSIRKQAAELKFLSQFMIQPDKQIHFYMDTDGYNKQMRKIHGKRAKFPSLQHRIKALYQSDYIRAGMQVLSNNHDGMTIDGSLKADDPMRVYTSVRARNFLGATRIIDILKHNYADDLPVMGTIMNRRTAEANHADYNVVIEQKTVKRHGHVIRYIDKKIKTTPVTIGQFVATQLKPWQNIGEGFQRQWNRVQAQHLLMAEKPKPLTTARSTSGSNKPGIS